MTLRERLEAVHSSPAREVVPSRIPALANRAYQELKALLHRVAEGMPKLRERIAGLRTRPRKRGKEL